MTDLKPAETNPWYVLMTLYGEQTGDKVDSELATKNIELWNIWSCQDITDEQRDKLLDVWADVPDPDEWEERKAEIRALFQNRFEEIGMREHEIPKIPSSTDLIDMSSTEFSNLISWQDAIFNQRINFDFAKFVHSVSFEDAHFMRDASFENAEFWQYVDFQYVKFSLAAYFKKAKFRKDAYFDAAEFKQAAFFSTTTFRKHADFWSVKFIGNTFFDSAKFLQTSSFATAKFSGFTSFRNTLFSGEASLSSYYAIEFSDAIFEKPTSFRRARFKYCYPILEGTVFHEKTQFTAERAFWPQDSQPDPKQAKESCATLRHVMAKQSLPEDEYFFFRKEMEFSGEIGGFWRTRPVKAYGVFSDYGASIAKPLAGLGALWLGCALIYMVAFNWPGVVDPQFVPAGKGFGFSIANMVKFLGFQRTYYADVLQNIPNWMQFLAAAQTTFAYVIVFFLGLGLRSRFRLR